MYTGALSRVVSVQNMKNNQKEGWRNVWSEFISNKEKKEKKILI
jgi:hypothetical protein